jgi:hypothetical protein
MASIIQPTLSFAAPTLPLANHLTDRLRQ